MKQVFLALLLVFSSVAFADTFYAKAAGGDWSTDTTWSATSSAGTDDAGVPSDYDDVIFDTGSVGLVTLNSTATITSIVFQSANNKLALANQILEITDDGNATLFTGMTLTSTTSTSSSIVLYNGATLTVNGVTIPGNLRIYYNSSVIIGSDWVIAGFFYLYGGGTMTLTGAYNISCSDIYIGNNVTFPANQTITISSGISAISLGSTVKSGTASTPFNIIYNGTTANCKIAGIIFTDVSSNVRLDNWCGGTLTRCTNIVNRTSVDVNDLYSGN